MQKKKKNKSSDEQKERQKDPLDLGRKAREWNVLKKRVTDERFKEIESFGLGELNEMGGGSEQTSTKSTPEGD